MLQIPVPTKYNISFGSLIFNKFLSFTRHTIIIAAAVIMLRQKVISRELMPRACRFLVNIPIIPQHKDEPITRADAFLLSNRTTCSKMYYKYLKAALQDMKDRL